MKASELGAAPQIAEPTSNSRVLNRNTVRTGKKV
jgi:hypothetical protein